MGLVFGAVSSSGAEIFGEYGKLILLLAFCMLFVYFISNPIIVFIVTRKNPYPLILKCLKRKRYYGIFTRSSAANIPVNMALCEELGLDKDMYSISIPLGATINMSGAAVTITIMTLCCSSYFRYRCKLCYSYYSWCIGFFCSLRSFGSSGWFLAF